MKIKKFSFKKFYDFASKRRVPDLVFSEMKQYDGKEVKYNKLVLNDGDTFDIPDTWCDTIDLTPISDIKIMNSFIREEFGVNFDTDEELSEFLILCEKEHLYWRTKAFEKKATEYVPEYKGTQTFMLHSFGEYNDTLTVGDSDEEYFEEYPIKLIGYKEFINIYNKEKKGKIL